MCMYACGMCDGMCVSYVNQFHYMGMLYFICQLNKQTRQVKVVFFKLHCTYTLCVYFITSYLLYSFYLFSLRYYHFFCYFKFEMK